MAKIDETAKFSIELDATERMIINNALSVQAAVYRRRVNAEVNPHIKELVKISLNELLRVQSRF